MDKKPAFIEIAIIMGFLYAAGLVTGWLFGRLLVGIL